MSEDSKTPSGPIFPPWVDRLTKLIGAMLAVGLLYVVALAVYAGSPKTVHVGYTPDQPLPYSHRLHVGQLGMDCRYCHNTVETAAFAAIPPTQTCMNCHAHILKDSEKLLLVRESYNTGKPIPWIRVHDLPDYVYFNHAAHVGRGIGCVSCHGRVDKMEVIGQVEELSMGWCLDCHRAPEKHLRPVEFVTDMEWVPEKDQLELGLELKKKHQIHASTDCSTCHR